MNLLAFDTSTERLSVAVRAGTGAPLHFEGAGGAQASSTLIPAVQRLLAEAGLTPGALDAVVFGHGPGSFTGLRTACSVAQGLAFGAGVPVLGIGTLLAVAEQAREHSGAQRVVAVLDARMEEVYFAAYEWEGEGWREVSPPALAAPESVELPAGWACAGNAFAAYGDRLVTPGPRIEAHPDAAALLRLAPRLIAAGLAGPAAGAAPYYIRDKVAQTSAERAAARAAKPTP